MAERKNNQLVSKVENAKSGIETNNELTNNIQKDNELIRQYKKEQQKQYGLILQEQIRNSKKFNSFIDKLEHDREKRHIGFVSTSNLRSSKPNQQYKKDLDLQVDNKKLIENKFYENSKRDDHLYRSLTPRTDGYTYHYSRQEKKYHVDNTKRLSNKNKCEQFQEAKKRYIDALENKANFNQIEKIADHDFIQANMEIERLQQQEKNMLYEQDKQYLRNC